MEESHSIEIKGKSVILKNGDLVVKTTEVKEFVQQIVHMSDATIFEDPLPDGVRFVLRRGARLTLVVVELRPQYRRVSWIKDTSDALFGGGTAYQEVRLAFPYIILLILFDDGQYTGYQQVYYRTAPLTSENDPLLFPNLRNCRDAHGMKCWLCLGHKEEMESLADLPWSQKIVRVVEYLWVRSFNGSADASGHPSYWTMMMNIDERVSSIARWRKASAEDPSFPLRVKWKPADMTMKQAMDKILDVGVRQFGGSQCVDLLNIVNQCESHEQ